MRCNALAEPSPITVACYPAHPEPLTTPNVNGATRPMTCQRGWWLKEVRTVLYWALIFLVLALIAGVFGFGGIASAAAGIAKILFFVFLVLFVVGLLFNAFRGRGP